jgi:phosphoglucomutase
LLEGGLREILRMPYAGALKVVHDTPHDYVSAYVNDLGNVLDMDAIRGAGLKIGVDPLGGAGVAYWGRIAERYGVAAHHAARRRRSHFPLHARRLGRQDPHGLLLALRHGRPDRAEGPLRCGLRLRYRPRPPRRGDAQRGPAESQSLPGGGDFVPLPAPARMAAERGGQDAGIEQHDRPRGRQPGPKLVEVPVGFKWFVDGLLAGSFGFGGEESAGASFLRRDGTVWTTDKDGIIMGLLAAEIWRAPAAIPARSTAG